MHRFSYYHHSSSTLASLILVKLAGNWTDVIVNLLVAAIIVVQYLFLFSAGTTLAPSQWKDHIPRYFQTLSCETNLVPIYDPFEIVLGNDKNYQPECFLDQNRVDELFTLMGLPKEIWFHLFRTLDYDHDGALRWVEIARCHVGWGWGCQNIPGEASLKIGVGPGGTRLNETQLLEIGPSMWEITWQIEAWRRVNTLKQTYTSLKWNKLAFERLVGTGLDNRPALNFL